MIGTRHGEKLYESLLSREEMAKAEDCGDYYRVPLDARSLDYGLYVEKGEHDSEVLDDYTSHNTRRMTVDEVAEAVAELPEMQWSWPRSVDDRVTRAAHRRHWPGGVRGVACPLRGTCRWGGDLVRMGPRPSQMRPARPGVARRRRSDPSRRREPSADPVEIERINPWLSEQLVASLTASGGPFPLCLATRSIPARARCSGWRSRGRRGPRGVGGALRGTGGRRRDA